MAGWLSYFFEVYNRDDWHIVIFGAGHVAQALVGVLLTLNCRVTCFDPRQDWIDRMPDHDRLKKVCIDDLAAETANLKPTDFVICMTMGHSTDRPILAKIFRDRIDPAYLRRHRE